MPHEAYGRVALTCVVRILLLQEVHHAIPLAAAMCGSQEGMVGASLGEQQLPQQLPHVERQAEQCTLARQGCRLIAANTLAIVLACDTALLT